MREDGGQDVPVVHGLLNEDRYDPDLLTDDMIEFIADPDDRNPGEYAPPIKGKREASGCARRKYPG